MNSTTTLAATEPAAAPRTRWGLRRTRIIDPKRLGPNQRQALVLRLRSLASAARGPTGRRELHAYLFQRSEWARVGMVTDRRGVLVAFATVHVRRIASGSRRSLFVESLVAGNDNPLAWATLGLAARWSIRLRARFPFRPWDHIAALPGGTRLPLESRPLAAAVYRRITRRCRR